MEAITKGYKFNFIEGAMLEKSPFTIIDFIQQRKRWFQGIYLVVHSKKIPFKSKIGLFFSFYSSFTTPLTTMNLILAPLYPIPNSIIFNYILSFIVGVIFYMYIFGIIKSYTIYNFGIKRLIIFICSCIALMPLTVIIENISVIWGIFSRKDKFYVVKKDFINNYNIV